MTNHPSQLNPKEVAYCKAGALLTLAQLRDDELSMKNAIEYLSEHLTEWEIIQSLTNELQGLLTQLHNSDIDSMEKALQLTLLKISSNAIE